MKHFVIFSGTTEGRELAIALADLGADVTVCVATQYGKEEQGEHPNITVLTGRKSVRGMMSILGGAALCVDATHPYAVEATSNIWKAANRTRVPYVRLVRERGQIPETATVVDNPQEAAEALAGFTGNILLTTGTKELDYFLELPKEQLIVRFLPSSLNLAYVERAGIPHKNIIAMEGPFSKELNTAIIHQYDIKCLVTKDGGPVGGFPEKAEAAVDAGIQLIVIKSPQEEGKSYDEVLQQCREIIG